MNRATIIVAVLFLVGFSPAYRTAAEPNEITIQNPTRIALAGFTSSTAADDSRALELVLAEALGRDARVTVVDQSIAQPALVAIGYHGSINMSKDEARKLGAAIGCDFLIVGKAETLTRSEREKESHEEAYAGLMIVDGRTGALVTFDFVSTKALTRETALQALLKTLDARASGYVNQMIQLRAQALTPRRRDPASTGSIASDLVEEVPADGSRRADGFKPPEFLNHVKPEYTPQAESADITATVEAMVVFRSNGEVGNIEITRWAGFGLDESAERAIRQLKFKPATRDGNPINLRAMIRYNFRRGNELDSKQTPKPAR